MFLKCLILNLKMFVFNSTLGKNDVTEKQQCPVTYSQRQGNVVLHFYSFNGQVGAEL